MPAARPQAAAVPASPLLQIQQVSIDYALSDRAVRAVHRVSLDVHEGDRFILRSITDEIMYELNALSGQQYSDVYATSVKEKRPTLSR